MKDSEYKKWVVMLAKLNQAQLTDVNQRLGVLRPTTKPLVIADDANSEFMACVLRANEMIDGTAAVRIAMKACTLEKVRLARGAVIVAYTNAAETPFNSLSRYSRADVYTLYTNAVRALYNDTRGKQSIAAVEIGTKLKRVRNVAAARGQGDMARYIHVLERELREMAAFTRVPIKDVIRLLRDAQGAMDHVAPLARHFKAVGHYITHLADYRSATV